MAVPRDAPALPRQGVPADAEAQDSRRAVERRVTSGLVTFRRDKDNRTRYVGQPRRGRPAALKIAEIDLGHAMQALESARTSARLASGDLSTVQRERVLSEVRHYTNLAMRFARGVMRELGPGKPKRKDNPAQTRIRWRK